MNFLDGWIAAYVLARIQKQEAFRLLDDTSWVVRSGAAEGLGSSADEAMIAALAQYEKDKSGRISRPGWLIKDEVRRRVKESQPVLPVHFKELSTPKLRSG